MTFNNPLELKETIARTSNANPDDIVNTKKALNATGYYTPTYGFGDWVDHQMFDGIEGFQKDNNLKIDGIMKPKGETETTINKKLSELRQATEKVNKAPKPINIYQDFVAPAMNKKEENIYDFGIKKAESLLNMTTKPVSMPKSVIDIDFYKKKINNDSFLQKTGVLPEKLARTEDRFHSMINITQNNEGRKYEDNPALIDQPTHTGIIQGTLDGFKRNNPDIADSFPERVKDLNAEQIKTIYRKEIYDRYRIETINDDNLAAVIFDEFTLHKPETAAKIIEEALKENDYDTGKISGFGSSCIHSLNIAAQENKQRKVAESIIRLTKAEHKKSPDYEKYGKGWDKRLDNLLLLFN